MCEVYGMMCKVCLGGLESVRDSPGSVGEVGGKGVWIVFASVFERLECLSEACVCKLV